MQCYGNRVNWQKTWQIAEIHQIHQFFLLYHMCIEGCMHSYIPTTLKTLQVIFIEYVCQMFCLYVTLAYILKMPTFKYMCI